MVCLFLRHTFSYGIPSLTACLLFRHTFSCDMPPLTTYLPFPPTAGQADPPTNPPDDCRGAQSSRSLLRYKLSAYFVSLLFTNHSFIAIPSVALILHSLNLKIYHAVLPRGNIYLRTAILNRGSVRFHKGLCSFLQQFLLLL